MERRMKEVEEEREREGKSREQTICSYITHLMDA